MEVEAQWQPHWYVEWLVTGLLLKAYAFIILGIPLLYVKLSKNRESLVNSRKCGQGS